MGAKRLLSFGKRSIVCAESRYFHSGQAFLADKSKNNWIGPPHPVSNLITWKLHKPDNESPVEKEFREKRIEVNEWNQQFWQKHNIKFFKSQKEYVKNTLQEKYLHEPTKTTLPVQDMAVFYKKFLDDNHQLHMSYNKEWYKKNFVLLLLAIKVKFQKTLYKKT